MDELVMMLQLPADAHVQIVIQPGGEVGTVIPLASKPPPVLEESGNGPKRLLQVGFGLAIFLVAFLVGQQTVLRDPSHTTTAHAQTTTQSPPQAGVDGLPPALREQLQRPPTITPPPGPPPSGRNGFGLEE